MISKFFHPEELVPEKIFRHYGDNSIWFLDMRIIKVLDFLRELSGCPITVNNWLQGGERDEAGFRLPDTTTGAQLSQHKFGRAADPKVQSMTPTEVYQMILANEKQFMNLGLTTMEDLKFTPTWNHLDCRWTGNDFIRVVKP